MIYPTRRSIFLALAGAPVAVLSALVVPGGWAIGAVWGLAALALVAADAWLAAPPGRLSVDLQAPATMGVAATGQARVRLRFAGAAPRRLDLALEVNDRFALDRPRTSVRTSGGAAEAVFDMRSLRRGPGRIEALWARWTGPVGLAWVQKVERLDRPAPVTPNVELVRNEALRLFARDAAIGTKAQIETGEGTEFHALKEFQPGMDLRAVDWKQSARHGKLVAREYRTERNHPVILALDTGRLMCAPLAGAPRIDHAIHAALLLAFVSLKLGDRVGLFAFDSKARIVGAPASGAAAYPLLRRLAAQIDYSTEETNFTLGLTTLASQLNRRGLIVIFTDFADPTSAELMLENVVRLLRTHVVLFVTMRDEELESLIDVAPRSVDDISRAVVAGRLLQEREAVIARLRRAGAQIVDARAARLGPEVVNGYLDAKRRELI